MRRGRGGAIAPRFGRTLRHLFGVEHGLRDLFTHGRSHRAGVVWCGLLAVIHLAMGSHDTLSLLGLVDLKPEWHGMHLIEAGLTVLVWLGHLLGDD